MAENNRCLSYIISVGSDPNCVPSHYQAGEILAYLALKIRKV